MNDVRKATLLAAASALGLSLGATIAAADPVAEGSGAGAGKVHAQYVKSGANQVKIKADAHAIKYWKANSTAQKSVRPATTAPRRLNPQPLPPG